MALRFNRCQFRIPCQSHRSSPSLRLTPMLRMRFRTIDVHMGTRIDTGTVAGGTDTPAVDTAMGDGATSASCVNAHKHRAYRRPAHACPGWHPLKLPPYGRGGPNQPALRGAAQQPYMGLTINSMSGPRPRSVMDWRYLAVNTEVKPGTGQQKIGKGHSQGLGGHSGLLGS